MREISPAVNATAEEFLRTLPRSAQELVARIRKERSDATRPRPSNKLLDNSLVLTRPIRSQILDRVANLVDENSCWAC